MNFSLEQLQTIFVYFLNC